MSALVIDSVPDTLHARLQQLAVAHQRSVSQEAVHQLERALANEEPETSPAPAAASYWANRKLLPEYESALRAGAFSSGTDSSTAISEERDAR